MSLNGYTKVHRIRFGRLQNYNEKLQRLEVDIALI